MSNNSVSDMKENEKYGPALKLPAGETLNTVAIGAGVDKSTASRAINGKALAHQPGYRKVAAYVERKWAEAENPKPVQPESETEPFSTTGQKLIGAVLNAAVQDREFVVLDSASGVGKSYCIKQFRKAYPEAKVFQAKYRQAAGAVLESLCRLLDLPTSGSKSAREDRIYAEAQGLILVVDEADLLVAGRKGDRVIEVLEIFRQLYEAGAVVILVGLPELTKKLAQFGDTYIYRRIGYFRSVKSPTPEELARFWEFLMADMPHLHPKAGLVASQARHHGLFGFIRKVAERTRSMDGDVEAAMSLLYRPEGV